jgi:hypothetical protein
VAGAGGLAAAAGIGIGIASSALPAAGGCYTHQCDAATVSITTGEWESGSSYSGIYTYETSPVEALAGGESWIPFAHNVTLDVTFPPKVAKDIATLKLVPGDFYPYVSTSAQPTVDNAGFTQAGSLAVLTNFPGTADGGPASGFSVINTSCASYFARFVVTFSAAPFDASAEASSLATTDASVDR